jgi:hypothetical protein
MGFANLQGTKIDPDGEEKAFSDDQTLGRPTNRNDDPDYSPAR